MRPLFCILITCVLAGNTGAQTPDWTWAKSAGSSGTDNAFSIAAHKEGSTYVTGAFGTSTITFGGTTLTNAGAADFFIAKYDSSGSVLWARGAGGPGYDAGSAVAADSLGNCYVTGSFEGTVSFGSVSLTTAGAGDIFVAKYDAAGTLVWAKKAGGSMIDGGSSIAVDRTGNSYVTGHYNSSFNYGNTGFINAGYEDLFIAKYDPSGTVIWVKGIGGAGKDITTGVAADGAGHVYLTGWYNSGSLNFGGTTITNTGQNDLFIVCLDSLGSVLWAKNAGGAGSDQSLGIAVDGSNNSYITGYYTNSSISFGASTLSNSGGQDAFIAKYDAAGNPLWARRAGGSANDLGYAIATDEDGYSYAAGWFLSSSISFGNAALSNAGVSPFSDLFVTHFDPSGNVVWAKSAGAGGMDVANGIALDGRGSCYLTGTFHTTLSFGAHTVNTVGGNDLFVAKMPVGRVAGIGDVAKASGYAIFPNPVSDQLHVFCHDPGAARHPLQVFDCTGRLVMQGEISPRNSSIDVRQLPAGVYGVRIGGDWVPVMKR